MQATPLPQHGSPMRPQAPLWQPPLTHLPWPLPHESLAAMQVGRLAALWSQQPPFSHKLPSQQLWSLAPHATQVPVSRAHTSPEATQKSAALAPPLQQPWPLPPHIPPTLGLQLEMVHAPEVPQPPGVLAGTHNPLRQQEPARHAPRRQQALLAAPHASTWPVTHTMSATGESPEA